LKWITRIFWDKTNAYWVFCYFGLLYYVALNPLYQRKYLIPKHIIPNHPKNLLKLGSPLLQRLINLPQIKILKRLLPKKPHQAIINKIELLLILARNSRFDSFQLLNVSSYGAVDAGIVLDFLGSLVPEQGGF
jgi:hypothetical protein